MFFATIIIIYVFTYAHRRKSDVRFEEAPKNTTQIQINK